MSKDSLPNFEKSLQDLEGIVTKMEAGQLSLDESLAQYSKGIELARYCQQTITQAEQKVQQLQVTDVGEKLTDLP